MWQYPSQDTQAVVHRYGPMAKIERWASTACAKTVKLGADLDAVVTNSVVARRQTVPTGAELDTVHTNPAAADREQDDGAPQPPRTSNCHIARTA
jgi:hypothetical protein